MRILKAIADRRFNFIDVVNAGQLTALSFTGFYWRGLLIWMVFAFLSATLDAFLGRPL